ncbi:MULTISPECIES: hypothetical protein [Lactobacillus]|uniref:hypothetical protein n=1 Tax=Lactobacillus acidophilus TaxID=1579 RepID=UPI00297A6EBA|nr:hypothetical protein [Lactobacillus amylovorus]MDD7406877.1 hypothetical protein [Lactobacillus amylovorus]MDY2787435.1 hypothetical protein [Lactobacillus amylovorus]
MALSLIPLTNSGIKVAFEKMQFALLKVRKVVASQATDTDYYTATLAVTADGNTYLKSNGEIVQDPNLGETFNVRIKQENLPSIRGMVTNVRLVNPIVHSVYATTAENSTFANINCSISADNLILPQTQRQIRAQGDKQ